METKTKIGFVWTNNNIESPNHVIKATLDWKQKSFLDLIYVLYNLMNSQYNDVKKPFLKPVPMFCLTNINRLCCRLMLRPRKQMLKKDEYFNKFLDQKIMRLNTIQPRKNAGKNRIKPAKTTASNNEQTCKIKNVVYFQHSLN